MFARLTAALRALSGPSRHDRELSYLNAAHDRVDLEYRQRQVDDGLFKDRPAYPNYASTALN